MNTTEEFSNIQNTSDDFRNMQKSSEDFRNVQRFPERARGIGRGKKYTGAETPDHEYGRDDFIIMEEAYSFFEQQGERRSVRMIAEYCKNGELVCFYDSDDKRWHITRASVENKISKIKALNARKTTAASPSTSENTSEAPAAAERRADERQQQRESSYESSDGIKKLEQENLDLKIVNRGKDYFIEQLQKERDAFLTRIENTSRLIGELETKLLQLDAPRPQQRRDQSSPPAWREVVSTPPPVHTDPPVSEPRQASSLSAFDNSNNNYEHTQQDPFAKEDEEQR